MFGNQLKTVFGGVMPNPVKTESGETVDAIFGAKSVYDRIVNSAFIIGTTNSLLKTISKRVVDIYRK